MSQLERLTRALADAFLSGQWTEEELARHAEIVTGQSADHFRGLARGIVRAFAEPPISDPRALATRIRTLVSFQPALRKLDRPLTIRRWIVPDLPTVTRWGVPPITAVSDLATWLKLELNDLEWQADRKGLERFSPGGPLRRYRYQWVPKRSGGVRLLESPREMLKHVQRQILKDILDRIPPHEAAHGFRRGRSVRGFATPHCGKALVVRLDLAEFFASITTARVRGIFRAAGYPESVASILAALCTNRTPAAVLRDSPALPWEVRTRLATPHLPQGAPTSPAIANLCAHALDVRLSAVAREWNATYTRYADDLAFSFESARRTDSLEVLIGRIAMDEGFGLNFHKTRALRRSRRQQIAGVVVNERTNAARCEFDALKATLRNCVRFGPQSQTESDLPAFRAHLLGRVSWMGSLNPTRGRKLAALASKIEWPTLPEIDD